jgi:hypothetical protein
MGFIGVFAMSLLKSKVQYYLIGVGGYSYNGKEGLYLQCAENYPDGSDLQFGSRGMNVLAKFDDIKKLQDSLKGFEFGIFNPAIVEFVPLTVQRGGNEVMTCEEITQVIPFASWSRSKKSAVPSEPTKPA